MNLIIFKLVKVLISTIIRIYFIFYIDMVISKLQIIKEEIKPDGISIDDWY